jgi:pilus assembly protein CpaF
LEEDLRRRVYEKLDMERDMPDEEIMELIESELAAYVKETPLSLAERERLSRELFDSLRKLDVLQQLVDDDSITEIMINGQDHIFYEKDGELKEWDKHFESREKLEDVIQQIVGVNNRVVNEASPIVDTRLKSGARVNVVLYPVSLDGPAVSIRKFPKEPITMEKLLAFHSISEEMVQFLKTLVKARYNLFISGGTGSGKTTFLNALSNFIPKDERIITIEDSAELQIREVKNLVRLETRNANMESVTPITIRDLVRSSLRMRPDRIIVGEVRGGECLDVLQAFNTGHDGSISTGHANSCKDMMTRLETMVLMGMELPLPAIRAQIASGIDVLVHLGRLRDRTRKVLDICELDGIVNGEVAMNPIYRFIETGEKNGKITGTWKRVGNLKACGKLAAAGFKEKEIFQ